MWTHPNVHANYFLVYMGPYLCQIRSAEKDECIYGIWGTRWTFLSRQLIQVYKPAGMCTTILREWTHNSAKLGQIREIEVSMESGEYVGHFWADSIIQAHTPVCLHTIILHAWTHNLAKLHQILEIKARNSMASEKVLKPILNQTKINTTEMMGVASLGTWYKKHIL